LNEASLKAGIVAYSSGNHAQGVALAARMNNSSATIIMPVDAPELKIANTKKFGAEVITYDRFGGNREAIGEEFSRKTGAHLVKPYDDPWVIAGQGTVGLEIAEQCKAQNIAPDALLAPAGGGGLIAGTSLALSADFPGTLIHSCEPAGFDDTMRSLLSGTRVKNQPGGSSICDAIVTPMPGELTFEINNRLLAGGFAVTDEEVEFAMAVAFLDLKIVVEPGGAVALAAILAGKYSAKGKTVVAITSGGNVDAGAFAKVLAKYKT